VYQRGSLLDGLAMYLSCDTKKFHDNESTHIIHNFWTSTHRGKLPPSSPLEARCICCSNCSDSRQHGQAASVQRRAAEPVGGRSGRCPVSGNVTGKARTRCLSAITQHYGHRISLKYRVIQGPGPTPEPLRWRGVVVSGVRRMNEVNARRARLLPGWVTVFGRVYHLDM